jgi:hypothetical protein
MKFFKDFRFMFQEINPSEFTVIIYETHIVSVSSNRFRRRPPNIRENKFKRL